MSGFQEVGLVGLEGFDCIAILMKDLVSKHENSSKLVLSVQEYITYMYGYRHKI